MAAEGPIFTPQTRWLSKATDRVFLRQTVSSAGRMDLTDETKRKRAVGRKIASIVVDAC
jgi:hypothetical protein